MKTIDPLVLNLCQAIKAAGGRAFLVGGWVRDHLRGVPNVDYDLEVYGVAPTLLRELLEARGTVNAVGEAFTVYKVKLFAEGASTAVNDHPIDVSLPRRESKVGRGHRGFEITGDPWMSFEDAARRRDFTINAVMFDPLSDEFVDPHHGREDIERRVIRAVDPTTFIEDSLRVLRAMQFAARFEFEIDPATVQLCRSIDLSDLPAERIWAEVEKWLLQSNKPSMGFWAAIELGITEKLWPEIHALIGCPQEYEWHPEGWSFTELPFQPRVTSPAQSMRIDDVRSCSLREFLASSATNATVIPISHRASATKPLIDTLFQGLASTSHTRADHLDAPSPLRPAILANSESLVWSFGTPTISANEIVRVVFQIPLDYVRAVVFATVNDFEIVRRIIHPVTVYVMNMIFSTQGATKYQLHDDSMDSDSSVVSRPTGVHIATVIADARTTSIDGYILFDYNLAVIRDSKVLHSQKSDINYRHFQVRLGDVFVHTALVLDEARKLIDDLPYAKKLAVMLGALAHDFGKPATTKFEDGRLRSKGHEDAGIAPTEAFLERLKLNTIDGYDVRKQVIALVADHLAPGQFHKSFLQGQKVSDGAFRRLAQRVEPDLLYRVARADCLGRTGNFRPDAMEWFIAHVNELAIPVKAPEPLLLGRHVLELGLKPGPQIGQITKAVYELQLDGKVTTLDEAIAAAKMLVGN